MSPNDSYDHFAKKVYRDEVKLLEGTVDILLDRLMEEQASIKKLQEKIMELQETIERLKAKQQ